MPMDYKGIVEATNKIIAQYTSRMTLRQIYYRLVAAHIIENKQSSYNGLSRILVRARESGDVDYRKIEDRVRRVDGSDGAFTEGEEYVGRMLERLEDMAKYFPGNYSHWSTQPKYVEVWVEKDALAGVLSNVTYGYLVPLAVARGYSSFTFLMDAVRRIKEAYIKDKDIHILYFGDFDPSGEDMVRDLKDRLFRYSKIDFTITKVALTSLQIKQHNLPPMPAKHSDTRSKNFIEEHGALSAVELALPPDVLERFVKTAILDNIDKSLWNKMVTRCKKQHAIVNKRYKEIVALIEKGKTKGSK